MDEHLRVKCPQCGVMLQAPAGYAGRFVKCAKCGAKIQVSQPTGAESSATQATAPVQSGPQPSAETPSEQPQASRPSQMFANRTIAGKTCPVCNELIDLGQKVRNCEVCGQVHHDSCWQSHGGCGTPSCANGPLPALEPSPAAAATVGPLQQSGAGTAATRTKYCRFCGEQIRFDATRCTHCGEYVGSSGRPMAPRQATNGLAITALVCGLVSPISCITAPVAIVLGAIARGQIDKSRKTMTGRGMATAGMWIGIATVALYIMLIVIGIAADS